MFAHHTAWKRLQPLTVIAFIVSTNCLLCCPIERNLADVKTLCSRGLFVQAEPPKTKGEDLLDLWQQIYDVFQLQWRRVEVENATELQSRKETVRSTVVEAVSGPTDGSNPVLPYEKLYAIVGQDGFPV